MHSESEPPGREHSSLWKIRRLQRHSSLLQLETVCLSAPNIQSGSDTLLPLPKKCLINLNAGLSFHKKLIEKSEIYFLFSSSFHQEGEKNPEQNNK